MDGDEVKRERGEGGKRREEKGEKGRLGKCKKKKEITSSTSDSNLGISSTITPHNTIGLLYRHENRIQIVFVCPLT